MQRRVPEHCEECNIRFGTHEKRVILGTGAWGEQKTVHEACAETIVRRVEERLRKAI